MLKSYTNIPINLASEPKNAPLNMASGARINTFKGDSLNNIFSPSCVASCLSFK